MTSKLKYLAACSLIPIAIVGSSPAMAEGTAAGTDITNTVTVNFQVGGVDQTAQGDSDTFKVDRKINLTVSESDAASTSVGPGEQNAVTTFIVQNTSNDWLDFALSASLGSGNDFDPTNLEIYVDNGDGVFNAEDDTATFIDELAADASVTVFIIGDIPNSPITGDLGNVVLTATAHEGNGGTTGGAIGALVTETEGADDAAVVDTVFADTDRDGTENDTDSYLVTAAAITVKKISTVLDDPFNGATNPKAIPGATVEYCIAVENAAGGAAATNLAISDTLPGGITFESGTILVDGTISGDFASDFTCDTGSGAAGDGAFDGSTVTGTIPSLAAGSVATLVFQVTVTE